MNSYCFALQVQYVWLQLLLHKSIHAWLQQPLTAAPAVPRPPLALARGCNSWGLLASQQQPSSASAAAAV